MKDKEVVIQVVRWADSLVVLTDRRRLLCASYDSHAEWIWRVIPTNFEEVK